MNADHFVFDTMVRFVTNMVSLSHVASIIVEHRRGLAEVDPARIRMGLFSFDTVQARDTSLWSKSFAAATDGSGRLSTWQYDCRTQ